jgi:hypothetical protein
VDKLAGLVFITAAESGVPRLVAAQTLFASGELVFAAHGGGIKTRDVDLVLN